jgi:hypothetical protein
MKYEDFRDYVRASLEYEIAMMARWQTLVPVSEVAKLGAIAFPGPGDEKYRFAVDHVVRFAAANALGLPLAPNPSQDLEVDRVLTPDTAAALRKYAKGIAEAIVERAKKAAATRATGLRYVEMPADFYPAFDCGVWERSATYSKGAMVSDHGSLWSCQADDTSDRPGTSGSWRLMVKNQSKVGR